MGDGVVVPFGRRPAKDAAAPAGQARLHPSARRGAPEAQALAAEQSSAARERYDEAVRKALEEKLLADGTPVPARITLALNVGGHEGPEVDLAVGTFEGNPDGDVDAWERGDAVPSAEQVRLLSELTGFPISYFYKPITSADLIGPVIVCSRRGCTSVPAPTVDERGVLHWHDDPPEPAAVQGALFGAVPVDRKPGKARQQPAQRPPVAGVEQPQLPTSGRMPDTLRAELAARLAAARRR